MKLEAVLCLVQWGDEMNRQRENFLFYQSINFSKCSSRYTMKDNFSRTFSNKCDLNITYCGQMCEINDESKQEDEQKNTKMIKGETSVQHIPDKDKEDGMVDTRKTDR